ncbi:AfsR/SARP family transcriptional regulator (plasmid) [Streptomyces sp. NBC_01298]|uniref:AfsR/SARP family transcriptional regulator n=1 Tax=Streptomyces sp. NBC_01298 TaxID=2903817 RepID=UPI002E0D6EE6|nr:AfsR/SARP family transcriptional regulator [Streptomyces sp. NBC_01298]
MEFRILGPVQIHDPRTGVHIVPTGPKQRALLGALVAKAGQVVSADRLVAELWGERPPANAANALQAHVTRLRRLFPIPAPNSREAGHEWLVTGPLGYVVRLGRSDTDAQRFHALATKGKALAAADPGRSADVLREALALWRGPALEGSGRGGICSVEASLLEEARLVALETLYDACLRAGRFGEIAGELNELTIHHPLRERFYSLLMTVLYRSGRRAEALGVYDRARRRFAHDLGLEPGPVLRGHMEAVLRHIDPDPSADTAPEVHPPPGPAPVAARPVRVPAQPTGHTGGLPSDAPVGPAAPCCSDAGAHLLREEIAWLRLHVDRLSQEQEELATRLDRLTTGRGPAV